MFDSIIIRKSQPGISPIDIGLLAECLLFYGKVHVIADMSMLQTLAGRIGLDLLEELTNQKHITLSFSPFTSATHAGGEFTPREVFDYCQITKVSKTTKKPDFEALFFEMLEKGSGKKGKSRRVGRRLFEKTKIVEPGNILPTEKGIPEISRCDLENDQFTKSAIEVAISHFAPTFILPQDWDFRVVRNDKGFNILTNIDLAKLNDSRSRLYFPDPKSTLSRAMLVDSILKANEDLFLSAQYNSEIITTPISSTIISIKCDAIIKKTNENTGKIITFQDEILSNAKRIREVINSGEKRFEDILPLLDRSKRFKKWTNQFGPDANLINEYYREITASSWIDDLPGKGLRLSLFTLGGAMLNSCLPGDLYGTIAATVLSAGDIFLLDKFAKGWKPNQYIDEIGDFLQ